MSCKEYEFFCNFIFLDFIRYVFAFRLTYCLKIYVTLANTSIKIFSNIIRHFEMKLQKGQFYLLTLLVTLSNSNIWWSCKPLQGKWNVPFLPTNTQQSSFFPFCHGLDPPLGSTTACWRRELAATWGFLVIPDYLGYKVKCLN